MKNFYTFFLITFFGCQVFGFSQQLTPFPKNPPATTQMTYLELPDIVLGSASAPVTLVEYSSLDCVHCAHFHHDVLPKIKEQFVDKGLVKIVYRHFPLDGTAVRAMAIISKLPQDKWYDGVSKALANQALWVQDVTKLGQICGIDEATCQAAIKDPKLLNLVVAKRYNTEKRLNIEVTPSFEILSAKGNEAILTGIKPEELMKKITSKI